MPHAQLLLLLSLAVTSASSPVPPSTDDTVNVDIGWAPSPLVDEDGNLLAPAVMYRVYASRDGGPVSYMCEVDEDTVCTLALERGTEYRVRVVGFDQDLRASVPSEFSDPIYYSPGGDLTDIDNLPLRGAEIEAAYPNPFNPLIRIRYTVGQQDDGSRLAIDILDVRGRRVAALYSGRQVAGRHEVAWNGTDETGRRVSSGAYFVRLQGASGPQLRSITMVK